jgi:hypothetical protein
MSSHVVGSMVSSMTSMTMRPESVRPIRSLRASRWGRSRLPVDAFLGSLVGVAVGGGGTKIEPGSCVETH